MLKSLHILALLFIAVFTSTAQPREILLLDTGWKFFRGHSENAYRQDFDDSGWRTVTVPHDWAIEGPFVAGGDANTGKRPWKGEGWYRRQLRIPDTLAGKKFFLLFDGVMAFPEVYVNGRLAGRWDYGYNAFFLDITPYVHPGGENVVAVHADTRNHDSRWYPGAGLYRNVRLIITDPLHIDIWGTQITTPLIKPGYAVVNIATALTNDLPDKITLTLTHTLFTADNRPLAVTDTTLTMQAGHHKRVERDVVLTNPSRWDTDHPYMYHTETKISYHNNTADKVRTSFGIREMHFTANDGFHLNGRRVQLRGVNLHHDLGPLGAAVNKRALERQLQLLRGMGCNAIRTSHNPPAPELLELCDSMGFLVLDEAFDKYDGKADITDTTDFEQFTRRNIRNFVMRDRNHPCIFLWSVGNEIVDVQWNRDNGFHKLHLMVNTVRRYDHTRPVTLVCDRTESAALRHFDYYDVHAWNYGRRYRLARQLEPDKSVIISESASTLSTRGFYELPLPAEKTDFTASLQISSYDLNAPEWAEIADDDFMWQEEEPYVAGEFVWTGFDYLGEPTPYRGWWLKNLGIPEEKASRSSYFGIFDLCGIPKDRYYLYKSHWEPEETMVHILPHWNWKNMKGKPIPVFVYTNGDCAELFLNGRSLGRRCKQPRSKTSVERYRLMWMKVPYEPGELRAVAYKEGKKTGEATVSTAGEPYTLRLTADRDTLRADGKDLSYLLLEAFDKKGNPCPLAGNRIKIKVTGAGEIAAVGNGNPQSLNPFQSDSVDLFFGKAMVIIRSDRKKGKITVEASAAGLTRAREVLTVQ